MSFFNRSGPCAPIHLVLPLLGSAVAFLSLISVFGVVATTTHSRAAVHPGFLGRGLGLAAPTGQVVLLQDQNGGSKTSLQHPPHSTQSTARAISASDKLPPTQIAAHKEWTNG